MKSSAARSPNLATVYWLILRHEAGRPEVLTVSLDGGKEALPVFSFADEAEMFLKLGGFEEDGWRTGESTAGDLISVLAQDLCGEVEFLALDPLPEMVDPAFGTVIALVTLNQQRFLERHVGKRRSNFGPV